MKSCWKSGGKLQKKVNKYFFKINDVSFCSLLENYTLYKKILIFEIFNVIKVWFSLLSFKNTYHLLLEGFKS